MRANPSPKFPRLIQLQTCNLDEIPVETISRSALQETIQMIFILFWTTGFSMYELQGFSRTNTVV